MPPGRSAHPGETRAYPKEAQLKRLATEVTSAQESELGGGRI